ncbi:Bro-N domain-containing protein [Bradyrhizobium zhanjiangense]|uniref:Bro-N domain-containing protein n=1 Tax=Bradyrhizobium zhanjiangense TaxID=1325107 RepID=A0ABY0DN43_9BRAD|nr:BRO family protein [Bradyrhizobium zhanjiangense]RXG96369.1 hypothetical protein EAS62_12330 [Bradyrhizobium zhanjiangense]
MQYSLQIFEAQDNSKFRTLNIDGEPWFVLADVCQQLELKPNNGSYFKHAERLDNDEKRLVARSVIDGAGPSPLSGEGLKNAPVGASLLMINEPGLYSLILRSNRPEAKRFKKWITSEVLPSIRKTGKYGGHTGTPAFIRRYNANWDRVAPGHFSVISELVIRLWGRLEQVGHIMADVAANGKELRPDVSVGKLFSKWLKENYPAIADEYSYYYHATPEGEFPARQYSNSLLPQYIEFVDNVWIPEHSMGYFRTRDPLALPHLPKLLPMAHKAKPAILGPSGKLPAARFKKIA